MKKNMNKKNLIKNYFINQSKDIKELREKNSRKVVFCVT